jgi:hypothetical protein
VLGQHTQTQSKELSSRIHTQEVAALEGTHAARPRERYRARKKSEREEQNRHVERINTKNFKSGAD